MNREKKRRTILYTCIFVLALVGVALLICVFGNALNKSEQQDEKETSDFITEMETVYIDGEGYLRRDDIKTYLFIGLDKSGKLERSDNAYNEGNQADFILLFVIDDKNHSCNLIHINRDTMTEVQKLGAIGDVLDREVMQICLSHAYGDGMHNSCINTRDAVSNLFYGIKIDKYFSASTSAVSKINDFIGGVTVTLNEDLTTINPTFTEGATVTLLGDTATKFIQGRRGVADQTNLNRMERQKQYMSAFAEQIKTCGKQSSEFIDLYNSLSDYIISDSGLDDLKKLISAGTEYKINPIMSPDGEANYDNQFAEFYVNEASLKEIVKSVFFEKTQKDNQSN